MKLFCVVIYMYLYVIIYVQSVFITDIEIS